MKTQATKQLALNYLNLHSETFVENLLLQEQTDTRMVYWSEDPFNNRGDFYEVVIDTATETIRWGVVKGFGKLNSGMGATMDSPIRPLHTLRGTSPHRDMFRFRDSDQLWVCWYKVGISEKECYHIRPVEADGQLGEKGETVPNALVRLAGVWTES